VTNIPAKAREVAMSNAENRHQSQDTDVPAAETSKIAQGKIPAPTVDDLYSDPEVCRRVGDLIAAVTRRPPFAKY
jgi:hypothetical protein